MAEFSPLLFGLHIDNRTDIFHKDKACVRFPLVQASICQMSGYRNLELAIACSLGDCSGSSCWVHCGGDDGSDVRCCQLRSDGPYFLDLDFTEKLSEE